MKLVFLSSFILIRKSNIIFTDNQNKVDITKERRRENLREKFPTRKKGRKLKNLIIEAAVSEMKATEATFSWVSFMQSKIFSRLWKEAKYFNAIESWRRNEATLLWMLK